MTKPAVPIADMRPPEAEFDPFYDVFGRCDNCQKAFMLRIAKGTPAPNAFLARSAPCPNCGCPELYAVRR